MNPQSTGKKDIKAQADEVLAILQESVVLHVISFLAKVGQKITKHDAENIIAKIGIKIGIKNETLAYTVKPKTAELHSTFTK